MASIKYTPSWVRVLGFEKLKAMYDEWMDDNDDPAIQKDTIDTTEIRKRVEQNYDEGLKTEADSTFAKDYDRHLLLDWRDVDTTFANDFTDERLLMNVSAVSINNGWGLVAELMKRFDKLISMKSHFIHDHGIERIEYKDVKQGPTTTIKWKDTASSEINIVALNKKIRDCAAFIEDNKNIVRSIKIENAYDV